MITELVIYDVKHTLASGKGRILSRRSKPIKNEPDWVTVRGKHGIYCGIRKIGRDCAINPHVALELAAELRDRKIHNLKKQIARLEALQVTIEEQP